MSGRIAAVVLAAGAGRRFGGAKLAAPWKGEPLLSHALRPLDGIPGVAVLRPEDVASRNLAVAAGLAPVENPQPNLGLSESLRTGLAALGSDVEWALIVLGDQPLVRREVIDALIGAIAEEHDLIRPAYAEQPGAPGHPVLAHRRAWALAAGLRGDQGLGSVVSPERVVTVPAPGSNPDVDTAADLDALPPGSPNHALRGLDDALPPR